VTTDAPTPPPTTLALEVCALESVRTWPGAFLVRAHQRGHDEWHTYRGATSQAELARVLEDTLTLNPTSEVLVSRIHPGGTPFPLAALNAEDGDLLTFPERPTGNGEKEAKEHFRSDYERIIKRELNDLEERSRTHQDNMFACAFFESLIITRRHRPKWWPPELADVDDKQVKHELEETMQRLRAGFEMIREDDNRLYYLLKKTDMGDTLTAEEEAERHDLAHAFDVFDNEDGTQRVEYANTTAGVRRERWDHLAMLAYGLATRAAPTPITWHTVMEPWMNDAQEQTPLLTAPPAPPATPTDPARFRQ
jgi:hypothetical protein